MDRLSALFEWLVDGAPGAADSIAVVERLGVDVNAAGIPLDRAAVFVTTLHPTVLGRSFYWEPGAPVRLNELTFDAQRTEGFVKSPTYYVTRTSEELRIRIAALTEPHEHGIIRDLAGQRFTDYLALPLRFVNGETHVITFATRRPGGFSDDDLAALRRLTRPLSRVAEIFALRRTAANLLSTYVGRNAGERVLAGRILRGDIETIRAVVWFSDLRGFTAMSSRSSPRAIIDTLNALFDCQVPAIQSHGGEVLKFIGDGLLAIFPCADESETAARCAAALEASDEAFVAAAERNRSAHAPIDFGVALHVGEIAYGNIGGAARLDFTAIGSAVNMAARLEGLTSKLGRRLVVSEELSRYTRRHLEALGEFELKGIPQVQRVFAPAC